MVCFGDTRGTLFVIFVDFLHLYKIYLRGTKVGLIFVRHQGTNTGLLVQVYKKGESIVRGTICGRPHSTNSGERKTYHHSLQGHIFYHVAGVQGKGEGQTLRGLIGRVQRTLRFLLYKHYHNGTRALVGLR